MLLQPPPRPCTPTAEPPDPLAVSTVPAPPVDVGDLVVDLSVYAPQSDSYLLVEAIRELGDRMVGARVLDLCCGTGIAAVAAARQQASDVLALDLNPAAVRSAVANAARHAPAVHARRGCLPDAVAAGPFDVVLCNPPYVPAPADDVDHASAEAAWDAGYDGRSLLDPLCRTLPDLLRPRGVALIVHSEVAGIGTTVRACRDAGLTTEVLRRIRIPLGPVMRDRKDWLVGRGLLALDADTEELAVVLVSR